MYYCTGTGTGVAVTYVAFKATRPTMTVVRPRLVRPLVLVLHRAHRRVLLICTKRRVNGPSNEWATRGLGEGYGAMRPSESGCRLRPRVGRVGLWQKSRMADGRYYYSPIGATGPGCSVAMACAWGGGENGGGGVTAPARSEACLGDEAVFVDMTMGDRGSRGRCFWSGRAAATATATVTAMHQEGTGQQQDPSHLLFLHCPQESSGRARGFHLAEWPTARKAIEQMSSGFDSYSHAHPYRGVVRLATFQKS